MIGLVTVLNPSNSLAQVGGTGSGGSTPATSSGGGGGAGNPDTPLNSIQFNDNSNFGGIAKWFSDGQFIYTQGDAGFVFKWVPTDSTTQNGNFVIRQQQQSNTPPDRRDDTFSLGWNLDTSLASGSTSSLSFEAFYITNGGINQSETYFGVSDGAGHSVRWLEGNYNIPENKQNTYFRGDGMSFYNAAGTVLYGGFDVSGISGDRFQLIGNTADTFLKAGPNISNGDIYFTPATGKKLNYQSSGVTASRPLILDANKFISTGTYSGTTTTLATTTGTLTNGHVAAFDANGNIVDGGTGASGCTVSGSSGSYQYNDGASGCGGDASPQGLTRINAGSVSLNINGGGLAQFIVQHAGSESVRLQSAGATTNARLAFADGSGGAIDTGISRVGAGDIEINNGTDGTLTGTSLNIELYKAGGTSGVAAATCTTVTSITIKGGIVTAISGAGC